MATLIGDGSHASDIARNPNGWMIHTTAIHHTLFHRDGQCVLIGVNNPQVRADISLEIGVEDQPWIHPHTWIDRCEIGRGTHINYGVTMTRTTIGHHCTISPGVTICGDVTIGDRVLVGAGATICDRVYVGDDVTIGAGAVVLPETVIPDGETWIGVPARVR